MDSSIITTVDVVLFTLLDEQLHLALLKRKREPFRQQYALPGGYVHVDQDQDTAAAARRVLLTKAQINPPYLEQLATFSGPSRDPRGWSISIAYYALVGPDTLHTASNLQLVPVSAIPTLPFDHNRIIDQALARLRNKAAYSSLPCFLLPPQFTLSELQHTYECVIGTRLDKSVFRRKLAELKFVEPVPDAVKTGAHRPAQLYRLAQPRHVTLFERNV